MVKNFTQMVTQKVHGADTQHNPTWRIIPLISTWLISMVGKSSKDRATWDPFQMAFPWLIYGGY